MKISGTDRLATASFSPVTSAAIAVSVRDARLTYGTLTVFENLQLSLEAGKITALLGPSGVGKTTLLRLLAGLETPEHPTRIDTGDGLPLSGRIAYMAQQDLLLPWASCLDNLLLGTRLRGERITTASRKRAAGLLAEVGLEGRENDRPASLSGGQRQRVALARTLMEDKPLVLMDEPFSALDALTRLRLQDLAARLLAKRTVLIVTHDPLEALRLADHIHVMTGSPATIGSALEPPGRAPRPVDDHDLLALQAELLRRLAV